MITRLFRIFWRCLIFFLGAVSLWLLVRYFIPFVDQRIPSFLALLAAYSMLAYFIIPFLIRLLRVFIKPNHIPHYATTGDGWPSDPVNIALIVKDEAHLTATMERAGWVKADKETFQTTLRALGSMIFNTPYPNAPFSGLYLFGRKQDIGFEISTNRAKSVRTRHHVRFWKLRQTSHPNRHPQESYWHHKLRLLVSPKKEIWIGAATEDIIPLAIRWRSGQFTHGVSHDANRERDFIIQSLRNVKKIRRERSTEAGESVTFRGQEFRTIFVTDSSLKVIELR